MVFEILFSTLAWATPCEPQILQTLREGYPEAKVELVDVIPARDQIISCGNYIDNGHGQVVIDLVRDRAGTPAREQITLGFTAKISAWVAKRRILPGAPLRGDDLEQRWISVHQGMLREVRGILLQSAVATDRLQARSTLLEGQPILRSSVEPTPDIRRGDEVPVLLRRGGLAVRTQGIANEPGYVTQKIRVISKVSKRDLQGIVQADGSVEVSL